MLLSGLLAAVIAVSSPAGPSSAEPHLVAARDGALLLSWLEATQGKKHALKFASMRNGKWSAPRVIAERDDFFVNWADFPSLVEDAKGTLFAHWLQKSGSGTYAYDVYVTSSRDGGKTWSRARKLNDDTTQSEHGFVSLAPLPNSGVAAVWLDGRAMTGGHGHDSGGDMMLRYAELDAALAVKNESVLDPRVCECCNTAMAVTAKGPVIAYRDRSPEEMRDIGIVRRATDRWSAPVALHRDGWKINGCPVNGPQLASRGNTVVAAWFTAPDNQPRVHVAFSNDGGATFAKPVRVDAKSAVGRVDVVLLADGSALATWIEGASKNAAIMSRRVWPNGRLGAPVKIADTSSARAAGFPRAALIGTDAYVAWTEPGEKRVRVARVSVK